MKNSSEFENKFTPTEDLAPIVQTIFENTINGIAIIEKNGCISLANELFKQMIGHNLHDSINQPFEKFIYARQNKQFLTRLINSIRAKGYWIKEIAKMQEDGEIHIILVKIKPLINADGTIYRYIAILTDITAKRFSKKILKNIIHFDNLTRLPNRFFFLKKLKQTIKNNPQPLFIILIDLDQFKDINDALGHHAGDRLLRIMAERLSGCIKTNDILARMGGDEFAIVTQQPNRDALNQYAQRILNAIKKPCILCKQPIYITASLGVSIYPNDALSLVNLLKNVEQAMYIAKKTGRNRFHYYNPATQADAMSRMRLYSDLHQAINEEQFEVFYQPIIDLSNNRTCKAEALIRWRHPKRGIILPSTFISLAEESYLITQLDKWVFIHAAMQLVEWQKINKDFKVFINTSVFEFRNGHSINMWENQLKKLGKKISGIVIEITEDLFLDTNITHVINKLNKLKELGIQVGVDDFGTGYSSYSYLKSLEINYLKINQSFIKNLKPQSNNWILCESIINLAHKLGIKVVAEDIETEEQLNALLKMGCDYGQGFLFAKPLPANEFETTFLRHTACGKFVG